MIPCEIKDLGLIEYDKAYSIQKECVESVLKGGPQMLIFCEHPAILTLGRMTKRSNLLLSEEDIIKQGINIQPIDRGGDVTLHSPGQLVIYPILNLNHWGKDLHEYLRNLEEVAIDLLKRFGILANRFLGQKRETGVWVGPKKIVSVGIGVRRWVSFHGLAINVNTDLNLFKLIKPCGLDVTMTSMAEIKGKTVAMDAVKQRVQESFKQILKLNFED